MENERCERKMCKLLGKDDVSNTSDTLQSLTYDIISKCTCEELRSFIIARKQDLPRSKLPKKGNVESALNGASNLISLAFQCRLLPNLMKKKIEDEMELHRQNNCKSMTN